MVQHKSMKTALTYSFVSRGLLWLGKTESPRISDQSPSTRVDDQRRSTKHRPPISANGPDKRIKQMRSSVCQPSEFAWTRQDDKWQKESSTEEGSRSSQQHHRLILRLSAADLAFVACPRHSAPGPDHSSSVESSSYRALVGPCGTKSKWCPCCNQYRSLKDMV